MTCSSCHLDSGRAKGPLTLAAIYGRYPQYSDRTHRVVAIRDRIAECFLYSMNGRLPPYVGRELIAIEAYVAFLSRGSLVGPAPEPTFAYRAPKAVDRAAGAAKYRAQCASCHGANGAGSPPGIPALWGAASFNNRAGMERVMAAFVQRNMPLGRGGTLTDQQAGDVAAYVLAQPRPRFDPAKLKNASPDQIRFFGL